MDIGSLIGVIVKVLALAGVGVALRAAGVLRSEDARPLNQIIIFVALPALVFRAVHAADLQPDLMLMGVVAWAAVLAGFGLAWLAARTLDLPDTTKAGFMLCAALGNTGYLGYPLALSLFGEAGLVRAIFYDIFGTVLAVLTIGLLVAGRFGDTDGKKISIIREVFTFPGVIALAAALTLHSVPIPSLVSDGLEALASLVVPLIMISLGLSLEPRTLRERAGTLSGVAAIKLVVLPVVAVGVGLLVLGDGEALRLGVMQAGMPSMMLSLVFGIRYRLDVDFIASAILVTTVGAIVTVPLAQILLG